jgi:hypothetical protein
MPGYRDAQRLLPDQQRADKLVDEARRLVSTRWTGQSWTEVGYSVIATGTSSLQWGLGIGLKIGINTASAGVFGAVGEQILTRASSAGYGVESLAQKISEPIVEKFWPLIEDVIKGKAEEGATALASGITGPRRSTLRRAKAVDSEKTVSAIDASVQDLKTKASELMLRSYALQQALKQTSVPYCDNVHYMSVELAQVDELRKDVLDAAVSIQSYAKELQKLAQSVDVIRIEAEIRKHAKAVVKKDSGVPHYNSYSWNMLGRTQQCSEVHCWGPHTTKM